MVPADSLQLILARTRCLISHEVCHPSIARMLLRGSGARVVFLDTPIEEMLQRCQVATLASAENLRPLAADPDAFRALYMERLPQYLHADLAVNTAGRTAEENAREIAVKLGLAKE